MGLKPLEKKVVDPDSFIIPASDTKGHSQAMHFRCMPEMAGMVDSIVAQRKFAYRTSSELLRHALDRHLRYLDTIGEIPQSIYARVEALKQILQEESRQAAFETAISECRNTISKYLMNGDHEHAKRVVLNIAETVEAMPEGYWKDRFQKTLTEDFPTLFADRKLNLYTGRAE